MGAAAIVAPRVFSIQSSTKTKLVTSSYGGEFLQVTLPYAFNALEPNIDARTMELHYTKHHAGYTKKFNDAVTAEKLEGMSIEQIFANVDKYSLSVRNNGGGYYNHNLFWLTLSPNRGGEPGGELLKQIVKDFGGFAAFKEAFSKAASGVFGSGWAWLIKKDGMLKIVSSSNQDNPLMNIFPDQGQPIMCLDVWEHAYYLNYQNRRADYISAFWNLVDWNFVAGNFSK